MRMPRPSSVTRACSVPCPGTYQGFMGALSRWTATLMDMLWPFLHQRMAEIGGEFWRIAGGFRSRSMVREQCPTDPIERAGFLCQNYGKGKTAKYRKKKTKGMRRKKNEKNKPQPQEPQAWITLLWHMGLAFALDVAAGSVEFQRTGARHGDDRFRKIPEEHAVLRRCGLRGISAVVRHCARRRSLSGPRRRQREFAGRERGLPTAENGLVLCWPKAMQGKQPPLRLRLVKVRIGKAQVYLLTSVLDPAKLTIKQMLKFYKLRWGIEVEFRGLKQTLDRGKLRCRNDQRLLAELNWSIMAMAVVELFALKEQLAKQADRSRQPKAGRRSCQAKSGQYDACHPWLHARPRRNPGARP